jgi:3-deoxy-7-phosphoheptulonate synthase
MVDCSHANARKNPRRQIEVAADLAAQLAGGERRLVGVMVESHLREGRQDPVAGAALQRGLSITDACLGWDDTVPLLRGLAAAVRRRRAAAA